MLLGEEDPVREITRKIPICFEWQVRLDFLFYCFFVMLSFCYQNCDQGLKSVISIMSIHCNCYGDTNTCCAFLSCTFALTEMQKFCCETSLLNEEISEVLYGHFGEASSIGNNIQNSEKNCVLAKEFIRCKNLSYFF